MQKGAYSKIIITIMTLQSRQLTISIHTSLANRTSSIFKITPDLNLTSSINAQKYTTNFQISGNRQTYRHTDIQTDRHTDIQTYRHTDIQPYRHTDIQTYRHTDIQTHRHTDIQTYRHTDIQTYRHTEIQTHRHKNIHTTYIHTYI